jgi:hypothetical protein
MNKPLQSMTQLIEKIRHLPAERIAEVEDFVDFLQERTKTRPAAKRLPFDFPVTQCRVMAPELKPAPRGYLYR